VSDAAKPHISIEVRSDGSVEIDSVVTPMPYPVWMAVGVPEYVVVMYHPDADQRTMGNLLATNEDGS
jgi:hypothetical protein